jgi:hypothetical protein
MVSALVLRESMRLQNSKYPFAILVTEPPPEQIKNAFDIIIQVPIIENVKVKNMWEKIHIFGVLQFDVITWLGADTLVLKNVDEMMDCSPLPCGVYDEILWDMDDVGAIINGDIIVIKPSLIDYYNLMEIVKKVGPVLDIFTKHPFTYSGKHWLGPLDQGVLNTYFRRYWTILPKSYHLEIGAKGSSEKNKMRDDVKIIHFAGTGMKPWVTPTEFSKKYWCPIAFNFNQTLPYCL